MRRDLFLYSICVLMLLLSASAFAQSGQTKTPSSSAGTTQAPAKPAATLDADPTLFPGQSEGERFYTGKEVDQKVRVNKKPDPSYTEEAKQQGIEGTVVLRCVFDSTGHVTHIHLVSGLPYGLSDRAIEAAQKIKFKPAMKDGHPVSMWMELQYNFHLH